MQARGIRRIAIMTPIVVLLMLTTVAAGSFEPGDRNVRHSITPPSLSRLELAHAYIQYLYLDEVAAGRGATMSSEVNLARWHLEYLQLPEVMAGDAWTTLNSD